MDNSQKRDRTPIYGLLFIGGLIAVFGLFAVAMQARIEVMIALVVIVGVTLYIILLFARSFFKLINSWAEGKYTHAQAMADKGIIVTGRGFPTYILKTQVQQIAAPVEPVAQIVEPPDPRREHALRLLTATIESPKYGTGATRIIPQKEAGAVGIIADDWSAGVAYLFNYGVMTGNGGTLIKDGKTVSRLMADVARGQQDAEASGVMALPEGKR